MSLEKQDILQCYANRLVPNYLPTLITQNQSHFTQYSLKPEFIKANVFEIFQNIAGNNPDLSMLSKSISQLHENVKPKLKDERDNKNFFIRIGEDKQGPFNTYKIIRLLKKSQNLQNVVIENSINGQSISADSFLKNNNDFKFDQVDIKFGSNVRDDKNKLQNFEKQSFQNQDSIIDIKSEKSNQLLNNIDNKNKYQQDIFNNNITQKQQYENFNLGQIPQQNFRLNQNANNNTYQLDQGLDFSLFGDQNCLLNDYQNSFSEDSDTRKNQVQQVIDSDQESSFEELQQDFQLNGNQPDQLAFWMQCNNNGKNQLSDITKQDEKTDLNNDSILQEIKKIQLIKQVNKNQKKKKKTSKKKDIEFQNEQIQKETKPIKKKKKKRTIQQEQNLNSNQFQQGNFVIPNNTIQNLYTQQNNINIVGQFHQQQILNPQELAQFQQNFLMSQNPMMNQNQTIKKKKKKKKKDTNKQNLNQFQSQFQNNFQPYQMSNQFYMNQNPNSLSQQQMQNNMSYLAQEQGGQGHYQTFYNGQYLPVQPQMMGQNGYWAYNQDFPNSQPVKKRSKKSKKQQQQNQVYDQWQGNYENGMYPNQFQNY